MRILFGIILFFLTMNLGTLFYMQIIRYDFYKGLSEKNRVRILPLEAPRGRIYDRNGKLIVGNRISFDVEVIYRELTQREKFYKILSGLTGIEEKILKMRVKKAKNTPFIPVKIAEDIKKEKAIKLEELFIDMPGVIITTRPMRYYPYGKTTGHIAGYLGRLSDKELERLKSYGYGIRDFIGKDGIEKQYNAYLKGVNGGIQFEVDNRGRRVRMLAMKEPHPGKDIFTTIDIRLQEYCDNLFKGKKGAIIVMDVNSGAILAMVSQPSYNPEIFISPYYIKERGDVLNDKKNFPLLNRAINGVYQPGSVFKIIVAASAFDLKIFKKEDTLSCAGYLKVGNRIFHCWNEKGHGEQDITEAIKNSCNVFFYQLGMMAGVDEISRYAMLFGLGKPTGVDLPQETTGLVPTRIWKKKVLHEQWYRGETANYSIGQGYVLVTPLQIVRAMSVIANGGKLPKPYLVERIEDIKLEHEMPEKTGITQEAICLVKEGLWKVVNAKHGTGMHARLRYPVIAGKTGTAQNPLGVPHAWFSGFVPYEEPKLAFVVFVEHGGKGGITAARLAKSLVREIERLGLL